jgi:hypothetical protein
MLINLLSVFVEYNTNVFEVLSLIESWVMRLHDILE